MVVVEIHTANPWKCAVIRDLRRPCLTESAKTNATGRVSVAVDASLFFNGKIEEANARDASRECYSGGNRYTPGRASVEACRDPFESILLGDLRRPCLTESAKVRVPRAASLFFNAKFEERTQETRLVNVTREGTDTHGQPVPGRASVGACREPFESIPLGDLSRPCLTESAKTKGTGCVSVAVDASLFFNANFEEQTQETRFVNVTREGTDTRGQPVPGSVPFESILLGDLSRPCLTESAKVSSKGAAVFQGSETDDRVDGLCRAMQMQIVVYRM
ncbi:hypothetical protein F2P79_022247 [Pimephales promelas]|nr:hypothetical protein F2P79_022247 [Pimephales promelas]